MQSDLGRMQVTRKTGTEPFRDGAKGLGINLLSFWQWSASDLVSNATRGVLAEFIVAHAVGACTDDVREEWAAYDVKTPAGVKIEVKSAAYLQAWHQEKLSKITFSARKTRGWDAETNKQSKEAKRHADVYVFALLKHQDKHTVDPLNVDQWQFYVLPRAVLDARKRSQHSITLPSLEKMTPATTFAELGKAVAEAAAINRARDATTDNVQVRMSPGVQAAPRLE